MPLFIISVLNQAFSASHPHKGPTLKEVASEALKAALDIGVEEMMGGQQMFAAEVRIDAANGTVRRFVVSMVTSPLQICAE